jgi:prepilin-type N-terminal cleavage/methylation domain-containing protein
MDRVEACRLQGAKIVSRRAPRGFTLIDLMIVIAIISVLTGLASQEFDKMLARARRTEAVVGLQAVWAAQAAYYASEGHYASTFDALGGLPMHGATRISPATARTRKYSFHLSQPWGAASFYCVAAGQLDPDPWPDILVIEEGRR